jgi:hypothetical protein
MSFPTLITKNQQGEQINQSIIAGSSQLWLNFVVDHSNGNGLGIRSLKGNCAANVFMNTSQTPATGNPNPVAGLILVELANPYAAYINGTYGFVSPVSGSAVNITSGLSLGKAYVITTVGTSTAANWQAIGLPVGVVPAVGVAFICTSASAGTGTGVVMLAAAAGAGIDHLEIVGDPNTTCNVATGALIILQCMSGNVTLNSYTPAGTNNSATPPIFTGTPAVLTGTTSKILTAPADNTVIGMTFNMVPIVASPL